MAAAAMVLALAAPPEAFRFSRTISAPAGWAQLGLPDDVLDACRAGLPDLRIVDAAGVEVPYAIERSTGDPWRSFPAIDLESVERVETVFEIDRGADPGTADALRIEVSGADFLKPVRVESSDDRASWKDVAKGSVFAAGDVRMVTIPLPATDRRYLRVRLDDRNGTPVRPDGAALRGRAASAVPPAEKPLTLEPAAADRPGPSAYRTALPAAHLNLIALRFDAQDPAFARRVRVSERVFFRDEVHRRLIAEGDWTRAPGDAATFDLALDGVAGRNLEIEIDDGDSPPLRGLTARAVVRPTTLRFLAPADGGLRLLYGASASRAPVYDLGRALAGRPGTRFSEAALGPAVEASHPAPAIAAPARVPLPDPAAWKERRAIALPATGSVAYLDLDRLRNTAEIRIVDGQDRQVPYIVEDGAHEHVREARLEIENAGTETRARIEVPADTPPMETPLDASAIETSLDASLIDAVELRASGPDYFSRSVRIEEEERDGRGVTGTRTLGLASWERRPGEPARALRIPMARPRDARHRLFVVVENGDNAPLALAGARVFTSAVRVDFVFAPGDRLALLTDNPNPSVRRPDYDFAMVASAVLAAPAGAARLEAPATAAATDAKPRPAWFWAAVFGAVLLLLLLLGRVLKKSDTGTHSDAAR